MSKNLKQKLEDRHVDLSWLTVQQAKGKGTVNGVLTTERIRTCSKEIARLIVEGVPDVPDPDPPGWKPVFPDRKEILALPRYDEYSIHYMGLAGWAYRNIDENPDMVRQQIYEVARKTRIAGARYLRSFLINGSHKPSERYIMDALPWEMVIKDGRKKIDFKKQNDKYWGVVKIIEEACIYWRIQHQPTFGMERYNADIFDKDNNIQGIHGEWSDESIPIMVKFMRDFMFMQKAMRRPGMFLPTFEFKNEPICWGNHKKLAMVADYHLALWRGVEDLTEIRRAVTCSGGCEGAHANFVERHYFDGKWYGNDEFKSRKVKPEWHGVSDLQSLNNSGFEAGIGSGWRHLSVNEDGSDSGSYSPIPWTGFKLANPKELYNMQYHGHTECARRNKKFYFTCFMLDCLRQDKADNMIAKEEFDPEQLEFMNWDRPNQYKQMRKDVG